MIAEIPYGEVKIRVDVPNCLGVYGSVYSKTVLNETKKTIKRAIENPIGTQRLKEIACGKKNAVIVVNDLTRPCPVSIMVEQILDELYMAGIKDEDIKILIANGNHRPMTEEEIKKMLGDEVYNRIKCLNHDCMDHSTMRYFGTTKRGVPIYVNRIVGDADLKITTGLIMPHQSAGFSGGRKSIIPGVSSIETLRVHHSFPIRPFEPTMGMIEGNSFHEEAMEGAKMVGVDFIVNTVQNEHGETVNAVAGDLERAYHAGVRLCKKIWEVPIPQKVDVVITSPGGYPRDIDLHQSQKAMASAERIVKDNGIIILVAECREGIGKFENILKEAKTPLDVVELFNREGYTKDATSKAFMLARAMLHHRLIIVNDFWPESVFQSIFFTVAQSVEEAINIALMVMGKDADFIVLPKGSGIIPKMKGGVENE